jgi:hypothetical protein
LETQRKLNSPKLNAKLNDRKTCSKHAFWGMHAPKIENTHAIGEEEAEAEGERVMEEAQAEADADAEGAWSVAVLVKGAMSEAGHEGEGVGGTRYAWF